MSSKQSHLSTGRQKRRKEDNNSAFDHTGRDRVSKDCNKQDHELDSTVVHWSRFWHRLSTRSLPQVEIQAWIWAAPRLSQESAPQDGLFNPILTLHYPPTCLLMWLLKLSKRRQLNLNTLELGNLMWDDICRKTLFGKISKRSDFISCGVCTPQWAK